MMVICQRDHPCPPPPPSHTLSLFPSLFSLLGTYGNTSVKGHCFGPGLNHQGFSYHASPFLLGFVVYVW